MKAANVTVESYWASLFAELCEKRNIEDLVTNVGAGGGGAAVAVAAPAGGAAAAAAPASEEKKVEICASSHLKMYLNVLILYYSRYHLYTLILLILDSIY